MQRSALVLEAHDCRSLMSQVRRIGRRVGPRSGADKRNKDDKELFCLRRYIATMVSNRQWSFPCFVEKGESPDFIVRAGNVLYGLEVTEATTQSYQQELTKLAGQTRSLDNGWIGDEPERQWCDDDVSAITAKVAKIKDYRSAQRHDILIYSNHRTDLIRGMDGKYPEYTRLKNRNCSPPGFRRAA